MSLLSSHVKVDLMNDECKMSCILGDTLHHVFLYIHCHKHIAKGGHPLDQWVMYTHIWGLLLLKDGGVFLSSSKWCEILQKPNKIVKR
jgi:hypothetical protein